VEIFQHFSHRWRLPTGKLSSYHKTSFLNDRRKERKLQMNSSFLWSSLCLGTAIWMTACTPALTPTLPPTSTPVPTVTPFYTPTPVVTALRFYTPTPTPDGSLRLFGTVWTMVHGQFHGVAGATVGIGSCFPRSFDFAGKSDSQGHFEVFVPAPELNCGMTNVSVTAPGYKSQGFTENVADLRTVKSYDIVLVPEATATPR
jgi:hypothetical protein